MAATIPGKLKTADVQRFATRAAQLEKYRPIVSYWCEYFILQIILNKQLHTTDEETQNYAIQLMDKLESYKSNNASDDAVVDDVAAKAYIESFALETFSKADDSQRANKVTRQTVDTFQAAAAFLDLLSIWGTLEAEPAAKSKFAKFHALRIARALKAGEDPNETNPKIEEPPMPEEDGLDTELKDMEGAGQNAYMQPAVETAPASEQPSRPGSTLQGGAPVLPVASPGREAEDATSRTGSVGGGYFPSVPTGTGDYQNPPEDLDAAPGGPQIPSVPQSQPGSDPAQFYNSQPSPAAPTPPTQAPNPYDRPERPPPDLGNAQPPYNPSLPLPAPQPSAPPQASMPPPTAPRAAQPPPSVSVAAGPPPGGFNTDDESVAAAQKHAKWAISALNFEDVPTAVKELKFALQKLGAA